MKTTVLVITAVMALACAARAQQFNEFGLGAGNDTLTGSQNTGIGYNALHLITAGYDNTANGYEALQNNTTGTGNAANGAVALFFNTSGSSNTADGFLALANSSGNGNIALGSNAGYNLTNGDNNIDIGNMGGANDDAIIRIGTQGVHTNTFIAGISGVSVTGGAVVAVNSEGQLGTAPAGSAVPQGAYLALSTNSVAPAGYTLLGTTSMKYKYQVEVKGKTVTKSATIDVDLYQKD